MKNITREQIIEAVTGAWQEVMGQHDNETIQDADWNQLANAIAQDTADKLLKSSTLEPAHLHVTENWLREVMNDEIKRGLQSDLALIYDCRDALNSNLDADERDRAHQRVVNAWNARATRDLTT